MLTVEEIKKFLNEDEASKLKETAREGLRYYEGRHDILKARLFYWNADNKLVEDKDRTNAKIPHAFFTELVDQAVQHMLSGDEQIICADDPKLQAQLDSYFNKNETFKSELQETITGMQAKGYDYMYARQGADGRLCFENADCIGVVEVEGRFAGDNKDQYIWKYVDRIDIDGHTQFKVLVIDDQNTWHYKQTDDGEIIFDDNAEPNPKPHKMFRGQDGKLYKKKDFRMLPFFRLDNNKKKISHLRTIKALIDDYDIMASSLTNNLADFDTPLHVVKGYAGDDLDKLQQNLKTKKIVGVDEDGGVEIHTVDVPYQARMAKLDHDERCIYKFGMGLNLSSLKDSSATTNIAIKAAYSLLELRCNKMIIQVKQFLRGILPFVINEINENEGTDYSVDEVYFDFTPEIMANQQENAQIALIEAQEQQARINTLMTLAERLDNMTLMQSICDILDIDYAEIEDRLPNPDEAADSIKNAANILNEE